MFVLILFILILSLLVLVHEFGHFIAARRNGVLVEEFGLGLPPRIYGKKVGDTIYSLNLLPFGGFVKLKGEDSDEISETALSDPQNFISKKPRQRALILISGVFMNLLLGILLYYFFFFITGFRTLTLPVLFDHEFRFGRVESINTVVMGFSEDSPAEGAGIVTGEAVLEVNGHPIYSVSDLRANLSDKGGEEVSLLLMDMRSPSRPIRTVRTVPVPDEEGAAVIGVYLSKAATISYDQGSQKIFSGFMHAYNMLSYTFSTMGNLIGISVEERTLEPVSAGVSGPVGIYSVIGSILDYAGDKAYLAIIDLVALMSLSLAIINVMPFPALDGGRLVFVGYEALTGRRVNPNFEASVHRIGMFVLLALIVLVTMKDVVRFF